MTRFDFTFSLCGSANGAMLDEVVGREGWVERLQLCEAQHGWGDGLVGGEVILLVMEVLQLQN